MAFVDNWVVGKEEVCYWLSNEAIESILWFDAKKIVVGNNKETSWFIRTMLSEVALELFAKVGPPLLARVAPEFVEAMKKRSESSDTKRKGKGICILHLEIQLRD